MHLERFAQRWGRFSQPSSQRRSDPADALPGFVDVAALESVIGEKVQDYAVHAWANWLHQVVSERAAVALVRSVPASACAGT